MNIIETENIDVSNIVAKIKKKASSSKYSINTSSQPILSNFLRHLNLVAKQIAIKNYKRTIYIKDLLRFDDQLFIQEVYRNILLRDVDKPGLVNNLKKLRIGKTSKTKIIARTLMSPEGYQHKVKIVGLFPRLIISQILKIPILGYILKSVYYHLKLPYIIKQLQYNQAVLLDSIPVDSKYKYLPSLDQLYFDFENVFRGSTEEITRRQSKYVKYIKAAQTSNTETVLDLGCGRGEWLKLLEKNNIRGFGVDSNINMIDMCINENQNVSLSDFIKFLEQSPKNHYLAITGFHIVEHIPYQSLVKLIDLSYLALKPKGLVIFETPNPENITVGSCTFYTDPSHLNPIPSCTLKFLLESRGFINTRKIAKIEKTKTIKDPIIMDFYNNWVNTSPDYAIIASKPND